jgi:glycerophosphoryl diester phosphodiesterase
VGADIVESDARLSKDGVVWACHDANLARLTGETRAIADLTSVELAEIRLPQNERLMTLQQVLLQVAPERVVLIDVKTDSSDLIDAIVRCVRNAGAVDRVWVGMRSIAQMKRAKELEPRLSLLAFLPDYASAEAFEQAGASAFRIWEGDLDHPEASRLFGRRKVWVTAGGRGTPWEVGDTHPDGIRRILEHEPDGILLNDPLLLNGAMEDAGAESRTRQGGGSLP